MRLPLASDIKTRTGAPDKDARLKNAYVEAKAGETMVRKRPIAQGGISVGTGTAQGGIGFSYGGTDYLYTVNGDVPATNTSSVGTTWNVGTSYVVGDHVSYNFVDYWALTDHSGSTPPSANWSTSYVPAVGSLSSWTSGTLLSIVEYTDAGSPIAWNGSVYCYLAQDVFGDCYPYTSPDGINWTKRAITTIGAAYSYNIVWNGTIFCAIMNANVGGDIISATSSDGITWSTHIQTPSLGSDRYMDIAWNGSIFCAVGDGTVVLTSPDGITWTEQIHGLPNALGSICWNGSVFCGIGFGTDNTVGTSPDGINWTAHTLPSTGTWKSVRAKGTTLVAVGANKCAYSTNNGVTWNAVTFTSFSPNSIAVSGSLFLVCNAGATSLTYKTSTDGITWTDRAFPSSDAWKMTYFGAKFIVTNSALGCLTSSTGL